MKIDINMIKTVFKWLAFICNWYIQGYSNVEGNYVWMLWFAK